MKPTRHGVPDGKLGGGVGVGGACLEQCKKKEMKTVCLAKCKDGNNAN